MEGVAIVFGWILFISAIVTLLRGFYWSGVKTEISRTIPDMLNAALKLSEENKEQRDNLLRRVVALWDLSIGDAVGSCQSLPQELVPVFVNLFGLNSSLCMGWRKVIYDRHFGASRPSEK